ncbi:MAG: hypothetical protein WCC78_02160 [Terriglobales bacterium]
MNLLITVIGNAAVHPEFRKELLNDPLATIDRWGFHLTKGEVELLEKMFTKNLSKLRKNFEALENTLYGNLPPCPKPCSMSLYPPPGKAREDLKKAAAQTGRRK